MKNEKPLKKINKADWKKFNLGGKAPRCPLCHEWMKKEWEAVRGFFVFACHLDKIAIRVDDPFVGRWDQAQHESDARAVREGGKPMECPAFAARGCPGKPRFFATSTGFMKIKCPKCSAEMSATNIEDHEDKVETITPEAPGALQ